MQLKQITESICSSITLSDFIGKTVKLQKHGREFMGLCPFHNEKTPSFSVNDQKGFYHCFGCGAHGNVINYVMNTQNIIFVEALDKLAKEAGIVLPKSSLGDSEKNQKIVEQQKKVLSVLEETKAYCHEYLKNSTAAQSARHYLKMRGILPETIDFFKIGYCDNSILDYLSKKFFSKEIIIESGLVVRKDKNLYVKFSNRIIFPIHNNDGKVIAFGGRLMNLPSEEIKGKFRGFNTAKYLNSAENGIFQKRKTLFNINNARLFAKGNTLIVVEGYMDVISMVQNGFPNTVAALGTAFTEEHISLLWKYCDKPILCFDGDKAGVLASTRAALRILNKLRPGKSLFFCYLPNNCDPDDILTSSKEGGRIMQKYLDRSLPLVEVLWNYAKTKYFPLNQNSVFLPEDQAALKQELAKIASEIKDSNIKKIYNDTFSNYFYGLTKKNRKLRSTPLISNLSGKFNISQKIFLGILLKKPEFLIQLDELLGKIDFYDSELHNAKEWLLDRYFLLSGILDDDFRKECNFRLQTLIGTKILKIHAGFLFDKTISEEEMLKRCEDIGKYAIGENSLRVELEEVSKKFKENFDNSLWQKVKTLASKQMKN